MRRYSDIELEVLLSKDDVSRAGDCVRAFEHSPAWFRMAQLLYVERGRISRILREKPSSKTLADYAEASGKLAALDQFEKWLDQITSEAIAANGN